MLLTPLPRANLICSPDSEMTGASALRDINPGYLKWARLGRECSRLRALVSSSARSLFILFQLPPHSAKWIAPASCAISIVQHLAASDPCFYSLLRTCHAPPRLLRHFKGRIGSLELTWLHGRFWRLPALGRCGSSVLGKKRSLDHIGGSCLQRPCHLQHSILQRGRAQGHLQLSWS